MSRVPCKRRLGQSACYHVIDRGHNREAVFKDAEDCGSFLRLLGRYAKRFSWRLYHYCLMTNHFHLLLRLEDGRRLSGLMAGLLRSYVHYFNRRHGFVGHLWQGRFKSPAVEAERYLLSCGRYIERNPVEAGIVEEPWACPWSSCRAYARGGGGHAADGQPVLHRACRRSVPPAGALAAVPSECGPRGGSGPAVGLGGGGGGIPPPDAAAAGAAGTPEPRAVAQAGEACQIISATL